MPNYNQFARSRLRITEIARSVAAAHDTAERSGTLADAITVAASS
ncbi:hypothetical protein [Burkholderia diffusa]|nr:hypothetical protein [Burkholderia diffusa]